MDTESQALFDELMRKQPHELLQTDIDFLKARESYLSEDQRELFGEVLGFTAQEVEKQKEKKQK